MISLINGLLILGLLVLGIHVLSKERARILPFCSEGAWKTVIWGLFSFAFLLFGLIYGDLIRERIDLWRTGETAGKAEADAGELSVPAEDIYVVYLLQGHGEAQLPETYEKAAEQLTKATISRETYGEETEIPKEREQDLTEEKLSRMEFRDLTFETGKGEEVPSDADLLMIHGALYDLTKEESEAVMAYLEQGGDLLLTLSADAGAQPRLKEVLSLFGVEVKEGILLDPDPDHYENYETILQADLLYSSATKELWDTGKRITVPMARPFVFENASDIGTNSSLAGNEGSKEETGADRREILLRTSKEAYIRLHAGIKEDLAPRPDDKGSEYPVAALIRHRTKKGETAKLLILGSSHIFDEGMGNEELFLTLVKSLRE